MVAKETLDSLQLSSKNVSLTKANMKNNIMKSNNRIFLI